ncbi:MAG: two-component sensor histidine kinase [Planctomycetales bacterium]|nr:two-component sensor histidine kinase [Planctomycetales bacterium]
MSASEMSQERLENQRLQQQYNEIAELAGALAHEIKNPLSVIGMNMELLAEDLADAQTPQTRRARSKVEIVQRQCHRLQNLLDDFLRFAHVSQIQLTPGNLNEQLQRVLALFAPQAHECDIEIIRYLDADLPSILMDERTLEAALVNLIKNAMEAMPDGGQLTVRTRLSRHGVALDLIDTGKGMDQTTAMHMFEAFYSTKEGGSGLGLPTARKGIEAHGGWIDVQSEVGRGTKFTIEFPLPPRIAEHGVGQGAEATSRQTETMAKRSADVSMEVVAESSAVRRDQE